MFHPHQPKGRCFNGIYPIPQFDILPTSKSGHTLSFNLIGSALSGELRCLLTTLVIVQIILNTETCFHGKIRKISTLWKKHPVKSYALEENFLIIPLCFTFIKKLFSIFFYCSFLVNSYNNKSQDKTSADLIWLTLKYLVLRQLWNNCECSYLLWKINK